MDNIKESSDSIIINDESLFRISENLLNDFFSENNVYKDLAISYNFIDNVLGGTKLARRLLSNNDYAYFGDTKYKFRRPKETQEEFDYRLSKLSMTQYLGKTIDEAVGILSKKPIIYNFENKEDIKNEEILSFYSNVDGTNKTLDDLFRLCTTELLKYSKVALLVDITESEDLKDKDFASIEDIKNSNKRPIIRFICPKNIINWEYKEVNNIKILDFVTIKNYIGDDTIYRTIFYGGDWIKKTIKKDGSEVLESGQSSFIEIPITFIFAKEPSHNQFIEPMFLDMAYHQVDEMELFTDLKVGTSYSCYTSFFISGASVDDFEVSEGMGPNSLKIVPNEQARISQIATNSSGLSSAMQVIEMINAKIAINSFSILSGNVKNMTAREVDTNREENLSKLVYISKSIQKSFNEINDIIYSVNEWDTSNKVKIQVNDDVSSSILDSSLFTQLQNLWIGKGLSLDTFWNILKRGEVLPSNFSNDKEIEKITKEEEEKQALINELGETI